MSRKVMIGAIACAACVFCTAAAAVSVMAQKSTSDGEAEENQQIVYAYVSSIEGNEVTYTQVEESVITALQEEEEQTQKNDQQNGMEATEDGSVALEGAEGTDRENRPFDGEMPVVENGRTGEEMPDIENGRTGEEMPDDKDVHMGEGMPSEEMRGFETVTKLIPVGTKVHTTADTETTFSRIAAGDLLKFLMETNMDGEEIIVEIWMIQ